MRPEPRSISRLLYAVAALTLALAARPSAAAAQDTRTTATLLRRLGEAVDGYRSGRPVWVVAGWAFPHDVLGVFEDSSRAKEFARPGFNAFGPYFARPDVPGTPAIMYAAMPCPHYNPTVYKCPRDSLVATFAVPQESVDSVSIVVWTRGGVPHRGAYRGGEVDALFFTMSAIDKFVVPYLTGLYGVDYAERVRDQSLRAFYGRGNDR
jgi:hypothetical protein